MSYQMCNRCIMDNATDKSISFNADGHCNYCSDVLKRMPTEYFPNETGKKILDGMIAEMKESCADQPYDCLVGVSGGIDSSYILYLGHQYGLRMLAVHVDDGLDNPVAVSNIQKLIQKCEATLITICPDRNEYADVIKSLFRASVPNLAIAQDNLIIQSLQKYGEKHGLRYSLDGNNMAHESILERGVGGVNACDGTYIVGLQKRFGSVKLQNLEFTSLTDRYLKRRYLSAMKHIRPLNYIPYELNDAIQTLQDFCGFEYYGGKHYESILTRFLQCYYLPQKFGMDKRKSHYSSLIVSGQMTREEAMEKLQQPLYPSEEMLTQDKQFLADFIGVPVREFESYLQLPPKEERSYPHSFLNELAPLARKFRRFLE